MIRSVAVSLVLTVACCAAQTLVRFAPSVGYAGDNTPVAAGFAYAFRAPAVFKRAKSFDVRPILPTDESKYLSQSFDSQHQNTIVPVFHSKVSKREQVKIPVYQEVIVPEELKTQYHSQDELGQYAYGYVHNDASHHEERTVNGGVTGTYSYYDDLGHKQSAKYVADRNGFRVVATNLNNYQPEPVLQTPEVLAATRAHLQAVKKEKSRKLLGKYIHVGISDTPEVAAAREAHLRAYDEIKRAHQKRSKRSPHGSYGARQTYSHSQFGGPGFGHQHFVPVTPTPAVKAATHAHLEAAKAAHVYGVHAGIPDTPAVAAAREAHLYAYKKIQAEHAKRWKRNAHQPHAYQLGPQPYQAQYDHYSLQKQYASNADNIHLPVTPTPEVQAATFEHLKALSASQKYGGNVHVGIPDTPEVTAAKQAHHYAYQKIQADHLKRWKREAHRGFNHNWQSNAYHSHTPQQYHDYQGNSQFQFASSAHNIHVPVTPTPEVQAATYDHLQALGAAHKYGGNVHVGIPDTPEVAAARDAHLYAYQKIKADHATRW
ncbi:uncharacterized protein LOC108677901 [Hyalella azteca]|uniref:Uncharacterized protein LOC108677901 n=1 Tax=Hyalella azteca TaxID=294128 RepID=A0A8B7P6V7_HYAAZ|nr:uncharacterized protein LOC108677901 [Hyalella azteca]